MKSKRIQIGSLGDVRQGLTLNRYIDPQSPERRILQVANLSGPVVVTRHDDRREHLDEARAQEFSAQENQILVSLRGSSLKASVVPAGVNAVISSSLVSITVGPAKSDLIEPLFIAALLNSKAMERQVAPLFSGLMVQGIPLSQFKKLTIDLPPIGRQQQIAAALHTLDRYRAEFQQHMDLRQEELEVHLTPFVIQEHD